MKNRPAIILAIILVTCSVVRYPCDSNRKFMVLLLELAAGLGLACWLWQKNKWVALFLLLAMFSMWYPRYSKETHRAFHAILFGLVWYAVVVQFASIGSLNAFYNGICVIALINIAWLVLQAFGIDPLYIPRDKPVGLMGNPNLASSLLAICFPAFLRRYWAFFLPAIIWGLIQARSAGGPLAVAVGLSVFLVLHGRFVLAAVPFIGFIPYALFANAPSFAARYDPWLFALQLWEKHWLFGWGIGHWKVAGLAAKNLGVPAVYGQWYDALHNDFLQGLVEQGIGFVVIVCGYFVDIIRQARRKLTPEMILPLVGLATVSANASVNFLFHIGTLALISITWLALLGVTLREA